MRRSLPAVLVLATLASLVGGGPAVASASAAQATTGSLYTAVTPVRVLDTRSGLGGADGPAGPGETVSLDLAGRLPDGATAVVLNVTGVEPTVGTYVTVHPHGAARPTASNLNLTAGEIRANLATVAVGADRVVDLYNNSGSTHLLADVAGYYSPGSGARYTPRDSERVLTTQLGNQGTATLDLSTSVPSSATAVVLNVTATRPTTGTYVTAWPYGTTRPVTSTVNLAQGATNANLTTVALGSGRRVSLFNLSGSVQVYVDLVGFYTPEYGAVFTPVTPRRVYDTRNGTGTFQGRVGPIRAGQFATFYADSLPVESIAAVVNLAGTQATATTFLSVGQNGGPYGPYTSNLNVTPGRTVANLAVITTDNEPTYRRTYVYNNAGDLHVIGDLAGYFWVPEVPCAADCAYAWGGGQGYRGVGMNPYALSTPRLLSGLTDVTAVFGSYALRSDGTVWAWGTNQFGELGVGWTGGESTVPLRVTGLSNVVQVVSTGTNTGLALRADGTVWAWGSNGYDVLGRPGASTATPARVPGLTGVRAIAADYYAGYALRTDGTVWSWGNNEFGKLGRGSTALTGAPAAVPGLTGVTQISANVTNAYALRSDGGVWAWGSNTSGQLGNNSTAALSRTPVRVTGLTGVTSVVAGDSGLMGQGVAHAVLADGSVRSWGQNGLGQLGSGSSAALSRVPVPVAGLTGVTELLPGQTVYTLRSDGSVWAWGDAFVGALGQDRNTPALAPVRVPIPAEVVDLAGRRVVDVDGQVWTWGYNGNGDLGIGHIWHVGYTPVRALISGVTELVGDLAIVPNP